MTASPDIILIRHAQSEWNAQNRFSGWADPLLTADGEKEAHKAGQLLEKKGYQFKHAFCSRLTRSRQTLDIILGVLGQSDLSVTEDWRLNERHYGTLQGGIKSAEAQDVSEEQIWRWRRSYLDKAEPLLEQDPRHPMNDPRYADVDPALLPSVENLAETRIRAMAFWRERVEPLLSQPGGILVSSHGNTLRALLMGLTEMSVHDVEQFEIPTGTLIRVEKRSSSYSWEYLG